MGLFDLTNIVLGDENGAPLSFTSQGADVGIHSLTVPEGSVGWIGAFTIAAMILTQRRLRIRRASS